MVVKSPVCPGERPTTASPSVTVAVLELDAAVGSRVACAVTPRCESKPWTPHQVTVYWSEAAFTKILPPAVGSRSARNGATRGGPVSSRDTSRSVLAWSASPNVMLPSELTNAAVCDRRRREREGTATDALSSSPSVRRVPSTIRKLPSIFATL